MNWSSMGPVTLGNARGGYVRCGSRISQGALSEIAKGKMTLKSRLQDLARLSARASLCFSLLSLYLSLCLSISVAASYTHRFARSTFQRFSYATFRLRKFSVAVWRGSEGIGVFLACHVETPGNHWVSLAHARTRNSGCMHIFKSP